MKNHLHPTDEILQAYLLQELQDDAIVNHMASCSACQHQLAAYQSLINTVENVEPETFSFDVTALAMNAVVRYEKKKRRKQAMIYWGLLIVFVISIASLAIPYVKTIASSLYSSSIFVTILVIGTGFIVLLYLLADLIRHYTIKEAKLFEHNLQPKPSTPV